MTEKSRLDLDRSTPRETLAALQEAVKTFREGYAPPWPIVAEILNESAVKLKTYLDKAGF